MGEGVLGDYGCAFVPVQRVAGRTGNRARVE
jgi:hypothetical protein